MNARRQQLMKEPCSHFKHGHRKAHRALSTQRGASAIEFALVFPVFFMIFYAIISYGLIMVAQQSISLAAAEGARAGLRFSTDAAARDAQARLASLGTGSAAFWIADRLNFSGELLAACPYSAASRCYKVTVTYPSYRQRPLTPLLLGPLMGFTVPNSLSSTAIVQIN